MRIGFSIAGALGALFLTSMAHADEPASSVFGAAHSIVISSDAALSFTYSTTSTVSLASGATGTLTEGGNSVTAIEVAPAADFFVIDNLSVGGQVAFVWEHEASSAQSNDGVPVASSSTDITAFGIGPRVGYNIAFSDRVSLWPKLGVTYTTASVSNDGGTEKAFEIDASAPVLFHVAPHFFLGFGPAFSAQLLNTVSLDGVSDKQPKNIKVGVQLTVGGWL